MIIRATLLLAGVTLAGFVWVMNCSGPQAEVSDVRVMEPSGPGEPYLVEAALDNPGPGKGQVEVTVRLQDSEGRTYQESQHAQVEAREKVWLVVPVHAPLGREYNAAVQVEYPPR